MRPWLASHGFGIVRKLSPATCKHGKLIIIADDDVAMLCRLRTYLLRLFP